MGLPGDRRPLADVRLPVLTGRAWTFADRLRADEILPVACADRSAAEAARSLFATLDPHLAARIEPDDVLVAGYRLGVGAGGAAAARALRAAGVIAVVAGSFADDFDRAVLDAGLPALEVDAPAVFHTGHRLRINIEGGAIANLSSGDRQPIRNLTDALLERLRATMAS